MKAEKNSFIVYHDIEAQTAYMTDEQVGQLFRAMVAYSKGKEPCLSDPVVITAFAFVKVSMDFNKEKYDDKCRKNQESGRKGGRPRKNQTAQSGDFLEQNRTVFEKPDTVYESESDTDTDSVRDTVSVSVSVLDCQNSQDTRDTQDTQTDGCDSYERDCQDALAYAQRAGYHFSSKQKKKLRHWCSVFPFESVILAFDRSLFYGGKSVTYCYKILQEWQDNHLQDPDAINAYISEREGSDIACAI